MRPWDFLESSVASGVHEIRGMAETKDSIDNGENRDHGIGTFRVMGPPAERTQGDGKSQRTCSDLGLTSHVEQFGVFEPFHLCGVRAIGFILWIFLTLWGRGYKEVDIFDQDFHRLIAQVHPMERERELAKVT